MKWRGWATILLVAIMLGAMPAVVVAQEGGRFSGSGEGDYPPGEDKPAEGKPDKGRDVKNLPDTGADIDSKVGMSVTLLAVGLVLVALVRLRGRRAARKGKGSPPSIDQPARI